MQAAQPQFDIRAIQSSWATFDAMVHLRPIHDEAGYDQMVALMNSLLDVVGAYSGETGQSFHAKLDSRSVATRGFVFYSKDAAWVN